MQKISVIGVGRLGICCALIFEKHGFDVLGCDISPAYVKSLNDKTFNSPEPLVSEYLKNSKNFRATTSLEETVEFSDLIWLLVATPTGVGLKSYDHSHLSRVLENINKLKVSNKHIIIGCTVLPGYTANVGRYLLRDCANTTLNYNPEFIAQGDIIRGLVNPDMVLIGAENKDAAEKMEAVYNKCLQTKAKICSMSVESAEITKLSINCMVTTKISFANMVGDIADKTPGADKFEILQAVGQDSRIGTKYLRPGYGFGGPCFPRDNRAIGNYAVQVGINPLIPVATDEYNKLHCQIMVDQFLAENKEEYLFEDVAYKPNCPVPIIEESQKLAVAFKLVKAGKKVTIRDRGFIIREVIKEFGKLFTYEITDEK